MLSEQYYREGPKGIAKLRINLLLAAIIVALSRFT
jgi:hypothetical protein